MNSLFSRGAEVISSDYKSAGSHQNEVYAYNSSISTESFEEVYVVPVGKTFYLSAVGFSCGSASYQSLATGAALSEVIFLPGYVTANTLLLLNFSIPLVFSSGTRISCYNESASSASRCFVIGWIQ